MLSCCSIISLSSFIIMDRRLIKLLFCTMLINLVICIPPSERERIRKLYEDSYDKIDEYLKTILSENNTQGYHNIEKHCHITKIHTFWSSDIEYKYKKAVLIDSNVSVTFDDLTQIKVPGVIRCIFKNDDVTGDEEEDYSDLENKLIYTLVLINLDKVTLSFVSKDPENNNDGRLLFLSEEAYNIRNLKNSYKTDEKYEEMKDWLQNNKDNINTVELCEYLVSKGELAFVIDVLSAAIEMERVYLSMDENQSIDLPGLLQCKIKYMRIPPHHVFFAKYGLNDDKNSYVPIHLSRNETADGNSIFALEYYRIDNTDRILS